ncbi:Sodium/potassium-transporting atpase subunit alpha-2, partial [Globisporangium splendens]
MEYAVFDCSTKTHQARKRRKRMGDMATTKMALVERVLTALYARQPHAKVVVVATGGGTSAAELLFRSGSSSTMLQYSVPYARASLQNFLDEPKDLAAGYTPQTALTQFCSRETSERMAVAAWKQAQAILRTENEQDDHAHAHSLSATLDRFRFSMGVACTAALATNYEKKGSHHCFLSVCSAAEEQLQGAERGTLQQRCETYHLNLSKTLKRTRNGASMKKVLSLCVILRWLLTFPLLSVEEDHIVSHWLVYVLAKAANVDPEGTTALHDALLAEQHDEDSFVVVTAGDHTPIDPLEELCAGSTPALTSVAFLPLTSKGVFVTIAKDLGFRGVVLSGSFNPLHQGHVDLARAAQRIVQDRFGRELPIAFEIAVANADKGTITSSTVRQRMEQFVEPSSPFGAWPVLVTNATLFSQKASVLKGCAFVIGADTAVRIVDKKYYDNDEHKMALTLQQIARNECFFVVAGRMDDKVTNRFISADEVLATSIPVVFKHLFVPLDESVFRSDISSTQIRNQQLKQQQQQQN